VDAAGNLTPAHASSIGRHGHQIGGAPPATGPRVPTGLHIIRTP